MIGMMVWYRNLTYSCAPLSQDIFSLIYTKVGTMFSYLIEPNLHQSIHIIIASLLHNKISIYDSCSSI